MLTPIYFGPQSSPRENAAVGDFVSRIVWPEGRSVSDFCSMGVFDGDDLVAGTLYHDWHPENGVIELTSGSLTKRWLTKPVINAMFWLPFHKLDCQLVALRVSEKNGTMIRIAQSFGFDEFFIPRLRSRTEGEYIFTFTDDQWRVSPYNKGA